MFLNCKNIPKIIEKFIKIENYRFEGENDFALFTLGVLVGKLDLECAS